MAMVAHANRWGRPTASGLLGPPTRRKGSEARDQHNDQRIHPSQAEAVLLVVHERANPETRHQPPACGDYALSWNR